MNKSIEIIINFRKVLLSRIETLSVEQLNMVPDNFSNNIIWNLGHMDAVLSALCYRNSELPLLIEDKYFQPYLPGTKPENPLGEDEINRIKQQLISSVEKLSSDLEKGIFNTYKKAERIEKIYNIKVESIDDAVKYIISHDAMHHNAVMTLKKALEKPLQAG